MESIKTRLKHANIYTLCLVFIAAGREKEKKNQKKITEFVITVYA